MSQNIFRHRNNAFAVFQNSFKALSRALNASTKKMCPIMRSFFSSADELWQADANVDAVNDVLITAIIRFVLCKTVISS
jgi:hypothetical protein